MAIVDVLKYNGGPDVFAWKYPSEELGTWTQLIVNESQEAVFFKGGQALDVFGPGRHTLDTANIPILSKLMNLPFGGRSPFAAEVWFINKIHALDIKWGTPSPIQIQDPKYGIFTQVRSFGQFGVKIDQSGKFLVKLVGAMPVFNKDNLVTYFRGLYLTKAKDSISTFLVRRQVSLLEINACLDELSNHMKEQIEPALAEYGITLLNFYVNDISVPEDDPAIVKLKTALAKRAEMNIIGYNYQQERSFDTLEGAATNPGSGTANLMGAGLGLGMGAAVGGAVGGQFSGLARNLTIDAATVSKCPQCQAEVLAGKKFCPDCGQTLATLPISTPMVIKCDKCGAVMSPSTKFCPECGDGYNPCPNCKADLPDGVEKCLYCGQILPHPCPLCGEPQEKPGNKFCSACGGALVKKCPACQAELKSSSKFCPECGQKILSPEA